MAQIAAELLPSDADPQLAHALMPVFEGLVTALLAAATVAVLDETEKQNRRIERHEAWTMERLDERSTTITGLRTDQRALHEQVDQIAADVEELKQRVVGDDDVMPAEDQAVSADILRQLRDTGDGT